jgi:peptidase E
LTSEEKENYERLEQSVIESKPKHGMSNGAVASNKNITDDNYMKSESIRAKQETNEMNDFIEWFNA